MSTKIILIISILLSISGLEQAKTQEPIDLEIVWQKEVFPKQIKFANFSADGQWIYAAANDTLIEKISAETGEFISNFVVVKTYDIDISEINDQIVIMDGNGYVGLWDANTGDKSRDINYSDNSDEIARCVTISPDGQFVIVASKTISPSDNSYLRIYNIGTSEVVITLITRGHVNKINFSHNGEYFVTGSYYWNDFEKKHYDQVILWSTETWAPVDTIETLGGVGSGYDEIKFSKDDKYLGCVRHYPSDGRIYNIENKELIQSAESDCYSLEFLPDNKHFLLYLNDINLNRRLNLYNNISGIVATYPVPSGTIDSHGSPNDWKIFCCSSTNLTMLKNKTIGIESEHIDTQNISISLDNNSIIIQTNNIITNSILVEIVDLNGSLIYSENIENTITNNKIILNPDLITGIYFCKLTAGEKTYSQKIEILR